MKPIVLIPARMASTRLPGKPLADIAGVPMIVRVWRQAVAAEIGPVVVAAAEREIADAIEAAGGRAVLTAPDLPSGSDRIFAALKTVDPAGRHDVVVNLQGDLPALDPAYIESVVDLSVPTGADIATLAAEIDDPADCDNPNVVKPVVVVGRGRRRGPRALFHARARAVGRRPAVSSCRHLCVHARRAGALRRLAAVAAGNAREARTIARAGSGHEHRGGARGQRAAQRRYSGRSRKSARSILERDEHDCIARQARRLPGRAGRLRQSRRARGAAACDAVPRPTFEDAADAVRSGETDLCIIPVENSLHGPHRRHPSSAARRRPAHRRRAFPAHPASIARLQGRKARRPEDACSARARRSANAARSSASSSSRLRTGTTRRAPRATSPN